MAPYNYYSTVTKFGRTAVGMTQAQLECSMGSPAETMDDTYGPLDLRSQRLTYNSGTTTTIVSIRNGEVFDVENLSRTQ